MASSVPATLIPVPKPRQRQSVCFLLMFPLWRIPEVTVDNLVILSCIKDLFALGALLVSPIPCDNITYATKAKLVLADQASGVKFMSEYC